MSISRDHTALWRWMTRGMLRTLSGISMGRHSMVAEFVSSLPREMTVQVTGTEEGAGTGEIGSLTEEGKYLMESSSVPTID